MKYFFASFLLFSNCWLNAQSYTNLQIGELSEQIIDREQILENNFKHLHSSIKPLMRNEVCQFFIPDSSQVQILLLKAQTDYLENDNSEFFAYKQSKKPFLKHFYKRPAHLYQYESENFSFSVNPMLNLEAGAYNNGDSSQLIYSNMRGLNVRGDVAKKVYFYTDLQETQVVVPEYISNFVDSNNAVPNAGFYKPFSSRFAPNRGGYDYLLATGYISFNAAKIINFQFGNGRNFIGDGERSLLLSNFSNNYNYLKINTRHKFFQYQNLFCELAGDHLPVANIRVPRKYLAAHYLSLNLRKNLQIGFYEAIVFGGRNNFELGYLNPVIFYRAVEQGLGSPDNAIIATTIKYNFLNRFSVYGQLVLDEFVFNEMFVNRQNWWGNKFGYQLGAKYINAFGVKNLDLQAEHNRVRPYTYTFKDSTANFTHYNQPLAHPLGANFTENILIARYSINFKWRLEAKAFFITQGVDTASSNWGGNLHPSYISRQQEYNNLQNQGVKQQTMLLSLGVSYMIKHNLQAHLYLLYRNQTNELITEPQKIVLVKAGIRYNFVAPKYDF
jgi:hypothetical protein